MSLLEKGRVGRIPERILEHPKNGNSKTLKGWAEYYGISLNSMRQRLYFPYKGKPWYEYEPKEIKHNEVKLDLKPTISNGIIFKPETVIGGEIVTYAAYIDEKLVASSLIKNSDGTWHWNCWDIGKFKNQNELVRMIMKIESGEILLNDC